MRAIAYIIMLRDVSVVKRTSRFPVFRSRNRQSGALLRNNGCHMHDARLRINYQHLPLWQECRRNYAYRYLILIISRLIGLPVIPSIIVDILCILSDWNCTEKMRKTASKTTPSQKYQVSQRWRGRRCSTRQHCELRQYKQYSDVHAYSITSLSLSFLKSHS